MSTTMTQATRATPVRQSQDSLAAESGSSQQQLMKRQRKARDGQTVSSIPYFTAQMNSLADVEESKHMLMP